MNPNGLVLVVDDEESARLSVARVLEPVGHRVVPVATGEEALAAARREEFDVVLCDIRLGASDGLELQKRLREESPATPIVMITAFAAVESAVRALKQGAYDYVVKPFSTEEIRGAVRRAVESRRLHLENDSLRTVLPKPGSWVGGSPVMKKLYREATQVAASLAPVFISGESGSGKEILARFVHENSPRAGNVFVPVNCAGIPETLADSQLFGHIRGAFTGAASDQRGLLEIAHGGTFFLDEIPELKPEIQAKLLRVLEDRKVRRMGSDRELDWDARIVAAAQSAPEDLVKEGRLREDLFFRIASIHLRVPPLRERPEEIAGLALHFLSEFSREIKKPIEGLEPQALEVLHQYGWPGNVRELKNVMERAAIFVRPHARVCVGDLPEKLRKCPGGPVFAVESSPPASLREVTKRYIDYVLELCKGNQAMAGRLLGVSQTTLWRHAKEEEAGT